MATTIPSNRSSSGTSQHMLHGADLGAAAGEHGRTRHGGQVGNSRVLARAIASAVHIGSILLPTSCAGMQDPRELSARLRPRRRIRAVRPPGARYRITPVAWPVILDWCSGRQQDGWSAGTANSPACSACSTTPAPGRPAHALISGDAGVGKTRLVTELAAGPRQRGFTVLSGRCAELADSIPYLPLADALRDGGTGPAAGPLPTRWPPGRCCPGCCPTGQAGPADGGDLPGLAQQQLFGAVLGMLAELASAAPGAADPGGPALGRPVHPGPGDVPEPGAAPGAGRAWSSPTAPTTCTGGTRCARWWPSCSGCPA